MTLNLNFLIPDKSSKNCKATIHKTGNLGFSQDAADKLNLSNTKSIIIAQDDQYDTHRDLYIIVKDDIGEDSFELKKAGDYYSIKTKSLFDKLGENYRGDTTIVFDIIEIDELYKESKIFKLIRREVKKRK